MGEGDDTPGPAVEMVGGGMGGSACRLPNTVKAFLFCCPENQVHCNISIVI